MIVGAESGVLTFKLSIFSEYLIKPSGKENFPKFSKHQDTEMLIPETLKTILPSVGLQEMFPITWQLQENGNHIIITLNMTKSSAETVAPVNSVTLLSRANYSTQYKNKVKSPSTRKMDQLRCETFFPRKSTQMATKISAAVKSSTVC